MKKIFLSLAMCMALMTAVGCSCTPKEQTSENVENSDTTTAVPTTTATPVDTAGAPEQTVPTVVQDTTN